MFCLPVNARIGIDLNGTGTAGSWHRTEVHLRRRGDDRRRAQPRCGQQLGRQFGNKSNVRESGTMLDENRWVVGLLYPLHDV